MKTQNRFRVLITDLSTRKSFDLFNILKQRGIQTLLCDDLNTAERLLLERAYGQKIERLRKSALFSDDLNAILKKHDDEKVIYLPVEEDTTLYIYRFSESQNPENLYYNLPLQWAFETVRDKGKFAQFCQKQSFPIPRTYDFETVLRSGKIPQKLILKPKNGSGSAGIRFIDTIEALRACKTLPYENYILQERIENSADVQGAFFLFEKGRKIAYYGHRRLRTYPKEGGVTIFSKIAFEDRLDELGSRLLEALEWSGIAMVEFLYDPRQRDYKIIEVNPRLWGSFMLSEYCGTYMIENYCRSAAGESLREPQIKEECYIRWIFPWDILRYVQSPWSLPGFWSLQRDKTCYINFTYASAGRAAWFLFYNMISPQKLARLYQKVIGK